MAEQQKLADERRKAAQENLELALANDPRSATPLEASEAYMELCSMYSHRGDGIPTQYVHGVRVAEAAQTMWKALLAALRAQPQAGSVEQVEQAFREGFTLGDFAGGGHADPRTVELAWRNSHSRRSLSGEVGG